MRREDRKKMKQARRLAGFKQVYEEAARVFLATLDESRVQGKPEHGYYSIQEDREILNLIGDEWNDIKRELRAYRMKDDIRHFSSQVLKPIDEGVEEQVRQWWKKTWRRLHLDFHIPPAPKDIDMTWIKFDQRTYQVFQFKLEFKGSKWARECYVFVGELAIWKESVPALDLNALPGYIPTMLPRLKSLARICDWSCFQTLSQPQQEAVRKRLLMTRRYYYPPDEKESIDEKINRKVAP